MAMSVTIVENPLPGMAVVKMTWVSASDGTGTGTTTYAYTGKLTRAAFDPDGGGTQPSDLYDITITDSDGFDVLNGLGANLSNAANVIKTDNDGLTSCASKLTLNLTNAGDTKGGVVVLHIIQV